MATTTRDLTLSNLAYISERYPSTHYTVNTSTLYEIGNHHALWQQDMLFTMAGWPSSLKHNQILGVQFRVHASFQGDAVGGVYANAGGYTPSSVTWYTAPAEGNRVASLYKDVDTWSGDIWIPESLSGTTSEASIAAQALQAASLRFSANQFTWFMYANLNAGGSPFARVKYDDATKITSKIQYKSGPASGYSNPRNATSFSWDYVKNSSNYCAVESWDQSSATFYWKTSSASSYTAVSCGTTKGATIPANTFPAASTIEWYVSGTDEEGATTQIGPYSFSTAAGTATAVAESPIGSAEDSSAPIPFTWKLTSTDGQTPSRVEASWKAPTASTWNTLADLSPAAADYTAPAGTFPAGEIQWRVRAYNIDGTAGPWSEPESGGYYSFISIRAPDAVSGLAATPVPISTISWQSDGQEAYEITIDGEIVQKAFGTDIYAWTVNEPLADGDHEISVRIQGVYGLWSQPSSITVTIENVPPLSLTLSGLFGIDADLFLRTGETPTEGLEVHWYRDGIRIARTVGAVSCTDRLSIGIHTYYAEVWDISGYYSRTNEVLGTTEVDGVMIAPFSGGNWMDIGLSDSSNGEQSFQWSRQSALIHVTGAALPVLEFGTFEDNAGSYSCAFRDRAAAKAFENLKGKTVIIKSRHANILVGALTALRKRETHFYTAFSWTLQAIEWEDFIDYDEGN